MKDVCLTTFLCVLSSWYEKTVGRTETERRSLTLAKVEQFYSFIFNAVSEMNRAVQYTIYFFDLCFRSHTRMFHLHVYQACSLFFPPYWSTTRIYIYIFSTLPLFSSFRSLLGVVLGDDFWVYYNPDVQTDVNKFDYHQTFHHFLPIFHLNFQIDLRYKSIDEPDMAINILLSGILVMEVSDGWGYGGAISLKCMPANASTFLFFRDLKWCSWHFHLYDCHPAWNYKKSGCPV